MRTYLYFLIVLLGLALESVGLGLLVPLVDSLDQGSSNSFSIFGESLRLSTMSLFLLVSAAIAIRAIVQMGALHVGSTLVNGWAHQIRADLHRLLFEPGAVPTAEATTGKYLNVITGEAWSAGEYRRAQLQLSAQCLALAVYGALLTLISWKLTLLLSVALLPFATISYLINRQTKRLGRNIVDQENTVHETAVASLAGSFTITTFGLNDRFARRFESQSDALRRSNVRIDLTAASIPQLLSIMMIPAFGGIILVGRGLGLASSQLVVFVLVLYRSVPQATGLMASLSQLFKHRAGVEIVNNYLAGGPRTSHHVPEAVERLTRIEIQNLTFGYPGSKPVVEDLSMSLGAGRTYQVLGESGAGKSTLISLILGLLEPSSGEVRVEGSPATVEVLSAYRSQIGYAGQRSSIFEDTLDWNVYLGRLLGDAAKRRIERDFGITDFASQLPDGMSTVLRRGGVGLSGGQLQRLQIARAVCGQPALLILDEATSELDVDSERLVMDAVTKHCPDAIILVVSHRTAHRTTAPTEDTATIDLREIAGPPTVQSLVGHA